MRLFAVRDAILFYEQARQVLEDHLDSLGPLQPREAALLHLFVQLGHAYQLNGALDPVGNVYQAMLRFARAVDLLAMECAALNELATFTAQMTLKMDQAAVLLQQALQVAEQCGDRTLLAETEWNLAQTSFYQWKGAARARGWRTRRRPGARLANRELEARCLNVIAYAYTTLGRWPACEASAAEARALYAGLGGRAMEADCLAQLATAYINGGRPQAGIEAACAGYEISTQVENGWGEANAALYLSRGLLEIGEYAEALKVARQGVAAARAIRHAPMLALNLIRLGCVQRAMLDLESALVAHREAEATSANPSTLIFAEILLPEAVCGLRARWCLGGSVCLCAASHRGQRLHMPAKCAHPLV